MDPFSTTLKDKNLGMYLIRLSWDTYYLIVSSLEEENLTERRGSNGSRNFDLGRLKLVEEFEGRKFRGKKRKKRNSKVQLTVRSCPSWWDAEGWFAVRTFRPRIVYRVPALKKKNGAWLVEMRKKIGGSLFKFLLNLNYCV